MPWTFAHPAAVLPLRALCPRYLSFPALVVGSVIPDAGYYIAGADFATHAHSLIGGVLICLPTGLLALWVLYFMRRPLCFILPQPHRAALTPLADAPVALTAWLLLKVAVSLVIGACTHIVWDAFTHKRDLIGLPMAWLHATAFQAGARVVPVYYVMQWLSTLAGTAILIVAYRRWLRCRVSNAVRPDTAREDRWRYRLLLAIAAVALVVAVPLAVDVAARFNGAVAIAVLMRCIAVFGAVTFGLLLMLCAVVCHVRYGYLGGGL